MKKIKWYSIIASLFMLIAGGWVYAGEANGTGAGSAVLILQNKVLDYFQPSSGTVTGVTESGVTIQLNEGQTARPGMRFDAFRKGAPFYHPVTGELIGYAEDSVGLIEVEERSSGEETPARVIHGELRTGDTVRITSSKIKLAFFQDKKADWPLSEAFFQSLKDSGRFELLESYVSGYEPALLAGKAREIDAEAVLMFSTPVRDKHLYINVKLYWPDDAVLFLDMNELVSQTTIDRLKTEDEFISSPLATLDPWAGYQIQDGMLLSMGDVDNDGAREVVISNGQDLRIFRLTKELQEVWMIKGNTDEQHLSIDILDLNKNGIAEIFVTSLVNGKPFEGEINDAERLDNKRSKLQSYIVEYGPAGYKKIKDSMPYFFRVIGNTLLMQRFRSGTVFGEDVSEGEWKDGDYRPVSPLKLPRGVNIYGFTFVDWRNNGENGLITFDDDGYITLYDHTGHAVWKSETSFGKFQLSFKESTNSMVNPVRIWSVRGRLITIRTERGEEVLAVRRVPFASIAPRLGTTGAEVYSLWWDGSEMKKNILLNEISGSITDYWVDKEKLFLIAKGSIVSFVKNAVSGEFIKGSMLYYFNFGRQ